LSSNFRVFFRSSSAGFSGFSAGEKKKRPIKPLSANPPWVCFLCPFYKTRSQSASGHINPFDSSFFVNDSDFLKIGFPLSPGGLERVRTIVTESGSQTGYIAFTSHGILLNFIEIRYIITYSLRQSKNFIQRSAIFRDFLQSFSKSRPPNKIQFCMIVNDLRPNK